jgi:phage shock protein PspC (stress-responsive transcriptional regulator)
MNTTQRIYRNTREGKLGGVAAGLGDYLAVDPVLIRLAFVLTAFLGGFGILAYLVAWIIIPPGEAPEAQAQAPAGRRVDGRLLVGIVVAGIGAIALAASTGFWWHHDPDLWPLLLVGIGAALILWRRDRTEPAPPAPATGTGGDPGPTPTEPEPGPAPGGGGEPEAGRPELGEAGRLELESGDHDTETVVTGGAEAPPAVAALAAGETAALPTSVLKPAGRRRIPVGWLTVGAVLAAAAVAALLDLLDVVDVSPQVFLVVAVGISAVGVVAGALVGRVWGPLAVGVASGMLLAGVTAIDVPVEGGFGDRTVRPGAVSELDDAYRLGAGKLVLDLRDVTPGAADAQVKASVAVGELVVIVPRGVVTVADGSASVGEIARLDRRESGVDVDSAVTGVPAGGSVPSGRLLLDLDVGVGRIETRVAEPGVSA